LTPPAPTISSVIALGLQTSRASAVLPVRRIPLDHLVLSRHQNAIGQRHDLGLDIPSVALLLCGMFNAYFLALIIASVIGTVAFAVAGRPALVIGIGLIAAFAVSARRCFLRQMDPSLVPGMPAMPMRRAGCIGAACCAMRSSLSLSWAAFLISRSRRLNQV
jgi:hypothetical protein